MKDTATNKKVAKLTQRNLKPLPLNPFGIELELSESEGRMVQVAREWARAETDLETRRVLFAWDELQVLASLSPTYPIDFVEGLGKQEAKRLRKAVKACREWVKFYKLEEKLHIKKDTAKDAAAESAFSPAVRFFQAQSALRVEVVPDDHVHGQALVYDEGDRVFVAKVRESHRRHDEMVVRGLLYDTFNNPLIALGHSPLGVVTASPSVEVNR